MVTVEHEICLKNPSRERAVEVGYRIFDGTGQGGGIAAIGKAWIEVDGEQVWRDATNRGKHP